MGDKTKEQLLEELSWGLKSPFSMFSETIRQSAPQPDRFNKAVVFLCVEVVEK